MFIAVPFAGCFRHALKEATVPVDVKIVDLNAPAPSHDEADVIITTHIKKASYLLSPRTADMPYTFIFLINGKEFKEDVKGVEEIESDMKEEKGKGIHYIFKKRLRLKPGKYEIITKTEYNRYVRVYIELADGGIHTLKFGPVYGPRGVGRMKTFWHGIIDYKVYLDGNEILKE